MGKGKSILESLKRINEAAWYGIDVDKEKSDNLKDFLRQNDLYFEPSSNGDLVHFEIQVETDDIKDMVNKFLQETCNEQVVNETEVYSNGNEVCINKKNSVERFIPTNMTADEVVDKFKAIMKHSVGRAWQWLKKVPRDKTVDENSQPTNEDYNQNTECPYTNILSDLANDENKTIEDYNKAIEVFNGSDVPNKEAIIERLSHIRDEELEHVRELNEMHALLDGGNLPEDNPVEPESSVDTSEESEDDFSLETEVVEESIETDSEVYKLLKGKEFDSYENIDKAFKDAGFEVTEVFREGDGFNIYATKDGAEYFIPFCACAGKYSAVIDTEQVNESKKAIKRTLKK